MKGIKGQETEKFERFFRLIQDKAEQQGCVFFCFAGEGRTFETDDMEGEDLSGWLIPKDWEEEFASIWERDHTSEALDKWEEHFVFALWNRGADYVSIEFCQY